MATEFTIGSTNSSSSTTKSGSSTSSTNTSASSATQDRFLKLLVAQMKNQDPLNPTDNSQFTSQMAQLSTVDGISKLNDTVKSLLDQFNVSQQMNSTSLIGHSVLIDGNKMELSTSTDGSRIAGGGFELTTAAANVQVQVYNSAGELVDTLDMGAADSGTHTFSWDGKTAAGAESKDGYYTFKVAATNTANGNTSTVSASALSVARVDGVKRITATDGSISTMLDLGGMGYHSQADVRSVY
ncbi:flagellar hook assembly protein FlgD [Derxia gummosa]|uniref:Basal-body rod modification protein FlgD n=1 Tax=Derxia gummosa DSM 723 TaxID=1121388 RepID=A0A8B6X6R0_9BURK|nr:flagellar hook assembly protein FlgD [Derxia gummosa]